MLSRSLSASMSHPHRSSPRHREMCCAVVAASGPLLITPSDAELAALSASVFTSSDKRIARAVNASVSSFAAPRRSVTDISLSVSGQGQPARQALQNLLLPAAATDASHPPAFQNHRRVFMHNTAPHWMVCPHVHRRQQSQQADLPASASPRAANADLPELSCPPYPTRRRSSCFRQKPVPPERWRYCRGVVWQQVSHLQNRRSAGRL